LKKIENLTIDKGKQEEENSIFRSFLLTRKVGANGSFAVANTQ
jgi:hypothetical protein